MSHIPTAYRIVFTYIEPISAAGGTLQLMLAPTSYLTIAAPHAAPHYHPALQTIMTTITGGWLIMLFNDLITLRVYANDVKLWRLIVTAHLISDLVYGWAMFQDAGMVMFLPWLWSANDWLMAVGTWPITAFKVAFLLGLGVRWDKGKGE